MLGDTQAICTFPYIRFNHMYVADPTGRCRRSPKVSCIRTTYLRQSLHLTTNDDEVIYTPTLVLRNNKESSKSLRGTRCLMMFYLSIAHCTYDVYKLFRDRNLSTHCPFAANMVAHTPPCFKSAIRLTYNLTDLRGEISSICVIVCGAPSLQGFYKVHNLVRPSHVVVAVEYSQLFTPSKGEL
jgi:hypothetical protein